MSIGRDAKIAGLVAGEERFPSCKPLKKLEMRAESRSRTEPLPLEAMRCGDERRASAILLTLPSQRTRVSQLMAQSLTEATSDESARAK